MAKPGRGRMKASTEVVGYTRTGIPVFANATPSQKQRIVFAPVTKAIVPAKQKLPEVQTRALGEIPLSLRTILEEIVREAEQSSEISSTMGRWTEFPSRGAAMLSALYRDRYAREAVNQRLDEMWASRLLPDYAREVVIGGGLHAAIYCAVRVASGFETPLVLEQSDRVGGAFAVSRGPSFYLNSRNRPGPLSIPGEGFGLNVLPGAMVQPADLGGEEYQTNEAIAYAVRTTLAMYGYVVNNCTVRDYQTNTDRRRSLSGKYRIRTTNQSRSVSTNRIVFATGIGKPRNITGIENDRILSFDQFMRRMCEPHPLRGMKRVAVIGGGDSGKTAIEALCGQGPSATNVSSLDYPEQIDWYGAPWSTCVDCLNLARIRYKRLAGLLPDPRNPSRQYRVVPYPKAENFSGGYKTVYVGQVPYDYLIDATGFETQDQTSAKLAVLNEVRTGKTFEEDVFVIGPAANLEVTPTEQEVLRRIDENKTSIFRYALRTATLASQLP